MQSDPYISIWFTETPIGIILKNSRFWPYITIINITFHNNKRNISQKNKNNNEDYVNDFDLETDCQHIKFGFRLAIHNEYMYNII